MDKASFPFFSEEAEGEKETSELRERIGFEEMQQQSINQSILFAVYSCV